MMKPTYEEMLQTFEEALKLQDAHPPFFVMSETSLRQVFGDEEVDRALAEGRAHRIDVEDDDAQDQQLQR